MRKIQKLVRVVIDDDSLVREAVEHALEEFIQYRKHRRTIEPRKRKDQD